MASPVLDGELVSAKSNALRVVEPVPAPAAAVAPWQPSALALLSDEEFERRVELTTKERDRIARIQKSVMKEGVDYGIIPGTDKPTLLKPGAEILNKMAGYVPGFAPELTLGDGVDRPDVRYVVVCRLTREDGYIVAEGVGSANSFEKKYRYRNASRVCPECEMVGTIIKGKEEFGGGWLCWLRRDGCGEKFKIDDQRIVGQTGKGENPDPHDLENTILKIAAKRAMIGATVIAHACSGIFAQDLEPDDDDPGDDDLRPPKPRNGNGKSNGAPLDGADKSALTKSAGKRASEIGDPSIGSRTILRDLHVLTDEELKPYTKNDLPKMLHAIANWSPPRSAPASSGSALFPEGA
jgi:hypothetical protein